MKILVNKHETITHDRLVAACRAEGAHVWPKVRVKDVLPIEGSGVSNEHFRFALQSHFDFVVADKYSNGLFAVEFDGLSHGTADGERRDALKNELCERFDLPLLRVNANHLQQRFRQWDLLSYFVETWFLKRAFEDAQDKGMVPWDEDFDPMLVVSDGGERRWPYWFSAPSQLEMRRLHKTGAVAHASPSHLTGRDSAGNYRCLAYLKVRPGEWAVIRTGMRAQSFDVCTSDVVWQVGIVELYEHLQEILRGRAEAQPDARVEAAIRQFQSNYDLCSSGGIVESPTTSAQQKNA